MPPNLDSPEDLGPRKRTLSTKVTTNGDPEVERQQKRLKKVQDKGATAAPTKKQLSTTTAAKATPLVAKQLSTTVVPAKKNTGPKATKKPAPQRPSVEIEEVSNDESDNHICDDIEEDPTAKPILVDSDEDDADIDDEEDAPEAPEESAEAELSMFLKSCIRH